MIFNILTLFPYTIRCFLKESILKRAIDNKIISVNIVDIRDFSQNKHGKVDDCPFGGGRGMVICPDPFFRAVESLGRRGHVVALNPMGMVIDQNKVREMSKHDVITFICGHYEAIDHRVIENLADEEVSIGDFILTGGELPACVLIDSITRELKHALGNESSSKEESFDETGLLEYEQYTRPANYRGLKVPEVLLSGNHERIKTWRNKRRLINTIKKRPDLLSRINLSSEYKKLLKEIEEPENERDK